MKRCAHKTPTTEELNPEFSEAKFFSKLDAKAGYWAIKLDGKLKFTHKLEMEKSTQIKVCISSIQVQLNPLKMYLIV